MKKLLKIILPDSFIKYISPKILQLKPIFWRFFSSSEILSSVFYLFFSREFGREHRAVLQGKLNYYDSLVRVSNTSALLRRNIHRIEKGLIMQPRRPVFALDYISETVSIYQKAVESDSISDGEIKWATDVLNEYFTLVSSEDSNFTSCKNAYMSLLREEPNCEVFVPYPVTERQKSSISFEELSNLFLRRRSVRWYKEVEVPVDLITKAIDVAVQAPSACNRQPYRFIISENVEMAREIAGLAGGTPGWLHNINSLVVVVGDLSSYPYERDRHLIYIDGGLVCMQFLLALETLGLSSCSINWPDIPIPEKKMADLLDLKQHERPVMLVSIGYPSDTGMVPFSQKKDSVTLSSTNSRDK